MKINCNKIVIYLIILGFILPLVGIAKAEIYDVGAGHTVQISNYLSNGDVITWDWHTTDLSEGLDFWIESPSGTRYSYQTNIQSWSGSFTVTSTGTWYIKWYNDNLLFTVTVEYDISTYTPYTGGDGGGDGGGDDFSIDWTPIFLLLIVVIIIIVAIAGIASLAGQKKQTTSAPQPPPPAYAQPPQQTQYQQLQQKYCQSCGRTIPSDSMLCPYCGAK